MATDILPPLYELLHGAAAVVAIVGAKIYRHGRAPQGTVAPYIVWNAIGADVQNTLSELPSVDKLAIQVDCYHTTDGGVATLARAARDAIEPRAHMVGIVVDEKEVETSLYRMSLQFDYWHSR